MAALDNKNIFYRSLLLFFTTLICCACKSYSENGSNESNTYVYENENLQQKIVIYKKTMNLIEFNYYIKNKVKNITCDIKGEAIEPEGDFGAESNIDEDGPAYFVNEYISDKTCWISIRIEEFKKSKLTIEASQDCQNQYIECQINSAGVLKLQ